MERQNFKLGKNQKYIHSKLLQNIIKESTVPKAVVEELYSELWYETLHGDGQITFKNDIKYTGHLKYGLLESTSETPSTINFPNGLTYTGTMKANQITGKGTYTYPNGSVYTGDVLNGLRHGKGTFTTNNGIVYEGEWEYGLKNGKGKITQGNMVLEGTWEKGVISGPGRITWKNGNVYEGECKDNVISGDGYLIWYNKNEKYTGQWKRNLQNGYGVHIWYEPKGEQKLLRDRYVGEWVNGRRNGYGRFFYSNGSIYEGYWENNQKDGFGIMTYPDKTRYIGNFKEDRTVDNATLIMYLNAKKASDKTNVNNQTTTSSISNATKKGNTSQRRSRLYSLKQGTANLTNTTNINNKDTTQTKDGLSTIKEVDKKTTSNAFDLKQNKENNTTTTTEINSTALKDEKKRETISKSFDEIKLPLDLSDIQEIDPEITKTTLKELDNILLRNLSFITHIYLYASGKESLKEAADLATSIISKSVVSETRSVFKNELNLNKIDQQYQQQEDKINYDQIYNNDLYFCLDLHKLWKLIKEVGLLSANFTLANFDRFYYQNTNNYIEMFYLPNEFKDKNEKKVYDYLYTMIDKCKKDFDNKYKAQIDQFNILVGNANVNNEKENIINIIETENYNIHNGENIIMLRYFYELLIRIAYLKYNHVSNMSLEDKVRALFAYLKYYFKSKRKNMENSLVVVKVLDIKLIKNWDSNLETFITTNKLDLLFLFKTMYYNYINDNAIMEKKHDMTITYRYLYENVLLKTEIIQNYIKDIVSFIGLVTIYHQHQVTINSLNDLRKKEVIMYIEQIMSNEFIFIEFCELVFIVNRKYNVENKIKQEDSFDKVFELLKKCICQPNQGVPTTYRKDYVYPKVKAHLEIEKLMREAYERKMEEERREREMIRYENERMRFAGEDMNVYVEEEDNSKSESFSEY